MHLRKLEAEVPRLVESCVPVYARKGRNGEGSHGLVGTGMHPTKISRIQYFASSVASQLRRLMGLSVQVRDQFQLHLVELQIT